MQAKILPILMMISFFVISCSQKISKGSIEVPSKEPAKMENITSDNIPYTIANRYFVGNDYKNGDLTNPKITSQAGFDKIFHPARIMGIDGKPTPIDFSRQYVLAVILEPTDHKTEIGLTSLKQNNGKIFLNCKINEGEKISATIQPVLLVIVDNKYQGEVGISMIK